MNSKKGSKGGGNNRKKYISEKDKKLLLESKKTFQFDRETWSVHVGTNRIMIR